MAQTKNATTLTADESYQAKLTEIKATMRKIEAGLDKHSKRQTGKPLNWGFVGDLFYILEELTEMSDFVNQTGEFEK
jgi:hypothetical protein